MTTAIATMDFKCVRVNSKNKETYRDLIGTLLSGTPDERVRAAEHLLTQDWATGNMSATVSNLRRVFTEKKVDATVKKLNDGIMFFNAHSAGDVAKLGKIDLDTPTKRNVLELIQALVSSFPDAKGEKAKMIGILNRIATMEAEREAAKLAREAEFNALQGADTTTS